MAIRCKSIAAQKINLNPGDKIIAGCELIKGSILVDAEEGYPLQFVVEDGFAGSDGATVLWPESGNDVYQYSPNERVPVGTYVHRGQVLDGDEWFDAPHTVENEGATAGPQGSDMLGDGAGPFDDTIPTTQGTPPEAEQLGGGDGFCDKDGVFPGEEDQSWLDDLLNLQLPDLKLFNLTGFTAYITKQLTKLSAAVQKVQQEVDKIVAKAKLDPDDICKTPIPEIVKFLMDFIKAMMKLMPILMKILQIIKIIKRILKIIKKILKWSPPWIVPLVEKLLELLSLMGLVDMVVNLLIQTVGRFMAILPILQAQLMAILAQCAGQDVPDNKEDCEAQGGTWVDPEDIENLQRTLEQLSSQAYAMSQMAAGDVSPEEEDGVPELTVGVTDEDSVGFCSIPYHSTQEKCEDAGGTWTEIDVDTDFSKVDTSALTNELAKQIQELDSCFADEELQRYLETEL